MGVRANGDRPNVLILMSDQHSRHYLGCYGHGLVRTPHLDRLAAEGMRFASGYTPAPLCVPARMSFMTGRRPTANRVWTNGHILSSALPTWAHALGAAGYETALVGRMHFVGPDQRHGFELRPLGEHSAGFPGAPRRGAPLFTRVPGSTSGQTRVSVEMAGIGRNAYQAFDETAAEAACRYLRQHARATGPRPFAAVVGFLLPHCPFFAPRDLFEYYYERVDVPAVEANQPEAIRRFRRLRLIEDPLPEERVRVARAAYLGMCEHLDRQIGRVLDALDESGLAHDTLVVYCSDHGELAGEHGCWWKSTYYEGAAGVPLIARFPGVVPSGAVNDRLCSLVDLAPTLVELAGAEPLPAGDGHSLWTELRGSHDPRRPDEVFSEHGPTRGEGASRMLRRGRWKLFSYGGEVPPVLFDLESDPGERTDLADEPRYAGIRRQLLEGVADGWDPATAAVESAALDADMVPLAAWGKQLQPDHPDTLPVPDAEDLELH